MTDNVAAEKAATDKAAAEKAATDKATAEKAAAITADADQPYAGGYATETVFLRVGVDNLAATGEIAVARILIFNSHFLKVQRKGLAMRIGCDIQVA